MIRIIGDCHGKYDGFHEVASDAEYVVHVGDYGFDYSSLLRYDPDKVKIILGNHDNYDIRYSYSNILPDYGNLNLNGIDFFYMRGSVSIDCLVRVHQYILGKGKSWWYEEEMDDEQLEDAIAEYQWLRPEVVISHDAPSCVKRYLTTPQTMKRYGWPVEYSCRTQQAMNVMSSIHRPKYWFFGHYHRDWNKIIDGVHYYCINELSYVDFSKDSNGDYRVTS